MNSPAALWLSHSALVALGLLTFLPGEATAQSSTYLSNSALADYSGMGANGGIILVPYELAFGTPPPSLGSSFMVAVTVSAITSYVPGVSYSWDTTPPDPDLGLAGLNYPSNVFTGLPAGNQTALPVTAGGITLDAGMNDRLWMEANLTLGNLDFLGEFTLSIAPLPLTPDYFGAGISRSAF